MAKLTEQDILNYDGDDYMNADHLEFFRIVCCKCSKNC